MNFKLKILSILTLLSLNCFAMETKNESDLAEHYEPASQLYQDLGKEAQFAVGIPESYHAPIIKMSDPEELQISNAYTTYSPELKKDVIFVNHEKMKNRPYGKKRCTMFHEASHVKERYQTFVLRNKSYLQTINDIIFGKFLNNTSSDYDLERLADIEGLNATQCFMCVNDHSRYVSAAKFNPEGYLVLHEVDKIIDDLEQKNKICAFHKEKYGNARRLDETNKNELELKSAKQEEIKTQDSIWLSKDPKMAFYWGAISAGLISFSVILASKIMK